MARANNEVLSDFFIFSCGAACVVARYTHRAKVACGVLLYVYILLSYTKPCAVLFTHSDNCPCAGGLGHVLSLKGGVFAIMDMTLRTVFAGVFLMAAVTALSKVCERRILRKRGNLGVDELKTLFNCGDVGVRALELIAKAYSISSGYLRPDDLLFGKSVLSQYDSWSLYSGYNEVRRLVRKRNGAFDAKWTVSDFVNWYVSKADGEVGGCRQGLAVEIEGESKIVFKDRDEIVKSISVESIVEVGYMTSELSIYAYDYLYLFNAEDTTYWIPMGWPHADAIIRFLSEKLIGYRTDLGLANVVHTATLTVWPENKAGGEFPVQQKAFPDDFSSYPYSSLPPYSSVKRKKSHAT